MIGIVVVSHGDLAEGMLSSASMISPDQKQLSSLCVRPDTNPDEFQKQLKKTADHTDTGDGVLILADLLGGTPCNRALPLLSGNLEVLTGVNLPMLLGALTYRQQTGNLEELKKQVLKEAQTGIADLRALVQKGS